MPMGRIYHNKPVEVFVGVTVRIDKKGIITPLSIIWDDQREFKIDKILDHRYAAPFIGDNGAYCYTCLIHGQTRELYTRSGQWFVIVDEPF